MVADLPPHVNASAIDALFELGANNNPAADDAVRLVRARCVQLVRALCEQFGLATLDITRLLRIPA
jgi:hypothetical protein